MKTIINNYGMQEIHLTVEESHLKNKLEKRYSEPKTLKEICQDILTIHGTMEKQNKQAVLSINNLEDANKRADETVIDVTVPAACK